MGAPHGIGAFAEGGRGEDAGAGGNGALWAAKGDGTAAGGGGEAGSCTKLKGEAPGPFKAGLGAPAPCNHEAWGSAAAGASGTTGLEKTESAAGIEGTGPGWPAGAGTGGKEDGAANGDGGEPGAGANEKGLGGGGVGSSGVDMMLGIGAGGAGGNGASAGGGDHGLPPSGEGDVAFCAGEALVDAVTAWASMKGEAGADGWGEEGSKPLAPGTPLAIWNGLPAPKLNGLGPP